MDTDNSGTITADELREAMQKQGSSLVQEELQKLLESIDVDATGRCGQASALPVVCCHVQAIPACLYTNTL